MHEFPRLARATAAITPDLPPLWAAAPPRRLPPRIARRRSLHGTGQEFADRHGRARHVAEHPLILGREPGRSLSEAGEQGPLLLAATRRGGRESITPEQRHRALDRRFRRGIGGGTGGWIAAGSLARGCGSLVAACSGFWLRRACAACTGFAGFGAAAASGLAWLSPSLRPSASLRPSVSLRTSAASSAACRTAR